MLRTPEEIAAEIEDEAVLSPSFPIFEKREQQIIHGLIVKAIRVAQQDADLNMDTGPAIARAFRVGTESHPTPAAPKFKPEGTPDKYRDLWNANMPRVSGCMYFAIPGEQPIHVRDDQARRTLEMLSSEEDD